MTKPRTLITGCNGQLGKELMSHLAASRELLGVDVDDFDLRDEPAMLRCLHEFAPREVLHTAAYTDVDGCESHEDLAMAVNGEAAGAVASICRKVGARMIHFSTDYVFDGGSETAYVEADRPSPRSVYGRSKLHGENLVAASGADHLVVRIAWLYGAHGKNFVRTMVTLAKAKMGESERGGETPPLKVVNDQFGNPTWTGDVARQTLRLLETDLSGVVHATSGGEASWHDFACEIFRNLGLDVPVIPCTTHEFPRPAPRPRRSSLQNERLEKAGLNIMRDWKVALADFLAQEGTRFTDDV